MGRILDNAHFFFFFFYSRQMFCQQTSEVQKTFSFFSFFFFRFYGRKKGNFFSFSSFIFASKYLQKWNLFYCINRISYQFVERKKWKHLFEFVYSKVKRLKNGKTNVVRQMCCFCLFSVTKISSSRLYPLLKKICSHCFCCREKTQIFFWNCCLMRNSS